MFVSDNRFAITLPAQERTVAGLTGVLSEPDHIMVLHQGADADRVLLSELIRG